MFYMNRVFCLLLIFFYTSGIKGFVCPASFNDIILTVYQHLSFHQGLHLVILDTIFFVLVCCFQLCVLCSILFLFCKYSYPRCSCASFARPYKFHSIWLSLEVDLSRLASAQFRLSVLITNQVFSVLVAKLPYKLFSQHEQNLNEQLSFIQK